MFYTVKSWVFPANKLVLRRLGRMYYHETFTLMEETLFQLLSDFFDNQQPFHLNTGTPYEKKPTLERHRELLERAYGPGSADRISKFDREYHHKNYLVYRALLDAVEWYRAGGLELGDLGWSLPPGTKTVEELIAIERENEERITTMLKLIIEQRGKLWT